MRFEGDVECLGVVSVMESTRDVHDQSIVCTGQAEFGSPASGYDRVGHESRSSVIKFRHIVLVFQVRTKGVVGRLAVVARLLGRWYLSRCTRPAKRAGNAALLQASPLGSPAQHSGSIKL